MGAETFKYLKEMQDAPYPLLESIPSIPNSFGKGPPIPRVRGQTENAKTDGFAFEGKHSALD